MSELHKESPTDLILISISRHEFRQMIREELAQHTSNKPPAVADDNLYKSIDILTKEKKISKSMLYQISSKRLVTTKKVGRHLFFHVTELEQYFARTTKKSLNSINADLESDLFNRVSKRKRN